MKLLFLIGSIDNSNANTVMARSLFEGLNSNKDIECDVFGTFNNSLRNSLFPEKNSFGFQYSQHIYSYKLNDLINSNKSKINKIVSLLKSPLLFFELLTISPRFGYSPFLKYTLSQVQKYKKELSSHLEKNYYDLVIAISHPVYPAISAMELNLKYIYYQLDPFLKHYQIQKFYDKRKALKIEKKLLMNGKKVIVTKLIMNDYLKIKKIQKYMFKTKVVFYPSNLFNVTSLKSDCQINFSKNHVNFLFVGTFYEDIRPISFLNQTLSELTARNIPIKLIVIGPKSNLDIISKVSPNYDFEVYDYMTFDRILDAMNKSDILVNLGNTISNQLPSKLLDYASVKRPILNIIQMDDCPTIKYLEKYPKKINIFYNKKNNYDDINKFINEAILERYISEIDYKNWFESLNVTNPIDDLEKIVIDYE